MRFFIAFFISLFIYLLLIWFFVIKFPKIETPPKKINNQVIKIDILNIPIPKEVVTPPPPPVVKAVKVKEKPKKIEKKKVTKKKIVKKKKPVKKKHIIKKKTEPKSKKKIVKKKNIVEKEVIKEEFEEMVYIKEPEEVENVVYVKEPEESEAIVYSEEHEKSKEVEEMVYIEEPFITKPVEVQKNSDDLGSFLGASTPTVSASSSNSYPTPKIKKLYGSAFHTFTPAQKEFIENNLNVIQRITQSLLNQRGYPEGAGRNRQEGTNVVTFNLHPNGDISDLHLKQRIGSRPLDDNTLSLIRSAYKDYPYPSTTTRIVFYVTYTIYGY